MRVLARVGEWVACLARASAIGMIASLALLAYAGGTLRRLFVRDAAARVHLRRRQRGRLLRWGFARLGATFVKVGQVMSSRPDVYSPEVIAELRWLQDRVPPFPFKAVRNILERELRAPLAANFRSVDVAPLAAGSVAQVHRAQLLDGTDVAVKVLRPGVLARIRRDGRIMLWLAHLATLLSARARVADVVGHVRSLVGGILAQTDLRRERQNYDQFRRNFAGAPGLAFPRVYRAQCTRAVLTMEFIDGVRLDDVAPALLPRVAATLREAFLAMCFDHGFVHADLHAGNVLVRSDGAVVLLDVGLVKHLSRPLLAQVVDFARCIAAGTAAELVAHLRQYHVYLASGDGRRGARATDWDAVRRDAEAFIARVRAQPMHALELSQVVGDLFALARRHAIRPLPEVTLVLVGMVTNEGIAKRLDPNANTLGELARFIGSTWALVDPTNPSAPPRRLARGSRRWSRPPLSMTPGPSGGDGGDEPAGGAGHDPPGPGGTAEAAGLHS
ncbi:MAG: AarF/ABC1/UbiB kinase family protein [Kofleriaceae bacterium]|nr:AarF/ABC1/UbiB kinase family protein [Kofleriaceae bacterium]